MGTTEQQTVRQRQVYPFAFIPAMLYKLNSPRRRVLEAERRAMRTLSTGDK